MDIVNLKSTLINKIQATDSTEMLEEIHRFLNLQEPNDADVYQLNEEKQNAIVDAREDIKKGRYSSDEDVNAEFEQWLKK
jgi:cell division protein FtsX